MESKCDGGGQGKFVVWEVREPFLILVPQPSAAEISMSFYKQLFQSVPRGHNSQPLLDM